MADELRFSRRVPTAGVNLCWIDLPPLDVVQNISLVETARFIAENINLGWSEPLDQLVIGVPTTTSTLTGNTYITTYNPSITNLPTSGSSSYAGLSTYSIPRLQTTSVSPSAFVIENFT